MGSSVILNDTLQLTLEQGFPKELNLEKHKLSPVSENQFVDRIFEFRDKEGVRNYQRPPVRNFLVENREGKWIYWGLVHILEVKHDYSKETTSGKFKIIKIYSPEEMDKAYELIDMRPETKFPVV